MKELLTAVLQAGGASGAGLLLTIVTAKVMAVVLGPQGVGLFALIRQSYQTVLITATLNGHAALVQGIAVQSGGARQQFLATVRWLLCLTVGGGVLVFLLFPLPIARFIAGPSGAIQADLIRWLSVPLVFGGASMYAGAVLNGHRAIGRLALMGVVGATVGALIAYPVAGLVRAGYPGAFVIQLGLPAAVAALLGFWLIGRAGWSPGVTTGRWMLSRPMAGHFLRLASATMLTGVLATLIPLAIRALTVRQFGLAGVGIFDVAWTISMTYVTVVLASFSTYYLPALSGTGEQGRRAELIRRVFRLETIVLVPVITAILALKPVVVRALYSAEFLDATGIMGWMLVGDYFKVASWVLAFTMLAFADVRTLLWTELVWSGLQVSGAAFSILAFNSLEGVGVTFLVVYALYFGFALLYTHWRNHFTLDRGLALQWLLGLAVIVAASAWTWHDLTIRPLTAAGFVLLACVVSSMVLTRDERERIWAAGRAAARSAAAMVNR